MREVEMTKEQIKTLVREKLLTKRIILFGAGAVAEEFYEAYKDKLNISHCVSNYEKEWGTNTFLGVLDVREYLPTEISKDDYVIVCGPVAFCSIELQLSMDGFSIFEDYIESNIAAAIFECKKIVLFYGQCVLRDIYQCILKVREFRDAYASIYTHATTKQAIVTNRVLYYAKDICDIYVYSPKVLDLGSIYFLFPEDLPKDCKMISVTNLSVLVYWPQIDPRREAYNPWYIHPYNNKRNLDFYHTIYRREDVPINQMILEGRTTHEIVETVSSYDFYTEQQVEKHFAKSMKLVNVAEKNYDVTIGDYIQENYKKIKLYQNSFHPNKNIIWEYIKRLLKELNIECSNIDELVEKSPEHIHQGGDVPIYPSVAYRMGLEFVDENTRYEVLIGNRVEYMTFREYAKHYVEYVKKAMEIANMW